MNISALARARWRLAVTERQSSIEPTWLDCARFAAPWYFDRIAGREGGRPPPIWDETAVVASDELASRLQSGLFPTGVRWLKFSLPPSARDRETQSLRELLDRIADVVLAAIEDGGGPAALHLALRDVVVFGTAVVRVSTGPSPMSPVLIEHVTPADVWLSRGSGERIAAIHIRHRMLRSDVLRRWPNAERKIPSPTGNDPDPLVDVVETWMIHPDRPRSWVQIWQLPKSHWPVSGAEDDTALEIAFEGGDWFEPPPYVVARWQPFPGSPWGISPVQLCLPAIRVLNETVRLVLAHADLSLSGMWLAEDDGVLNPETIRLQPGAIIPIAPGSQGLRPLDPPDSRFSLAQIVIEDYRNAIRRALRTDMLLARTTETPPTALEVQARLRELARQIGPSLDRLWRELTRPIVDIVIRRLADVGRIERSIAADVSALDLAPSTALTAAERSDEFRRASELATVVAQIYGPQTLAMWLPAERLLRLGVHALDLKPDLVLDRSEVERNVRATAQGAMDVAGAMPADREAAASQMDAAREIVDRLLSGVK